MAAGPDQLFNLRNNFYLGAYQAAINNSEVPNLSQDDAVERDSLVYRSYIALGSFQLVVSEIDSSAATPLQAVKLLALYLSSPDNKVLFFSSSEFRSCFLFRKAAFGSESIFLSTQMGMRWICDFEWNPVLSHQT